MRKPPPPHPPPPFTRAMLIYGSKFCDFFKKGHPRNIRVKLFQNVTSGFREEDFFKEFLHIRIVQEAPVYQSHVYGRIRILRTIFEKSHPKNIPVELFQNWTSGFGEEDFLKISSFCEQLTTHDGHWTTPRAPLEHVVLRSAKKGTFLDRK